MIAFDFSNAPKQPCRAAKREEKGYADGYTTSSRNDNGGRLTVRIGSPDVQRTAAMSERPKGSDSPGARLPLRGITVKERKTVIQPARRAFSVPVNRVPATEDTPNRTLIVVPGQISLPRSTHRDGTLTQGCGPTNSDRSDVTYSPHAGVAA